MSMAQYPLVSVITVNFNGERYLEGLLRSLERQTYPNVEILVVDNGSTDGSLALIRESFPEVRIVEAGGNLGFTGGNNLGMREAKGDYLALLNNDTVVEPTWLASLMEAIRSDPDLGGVGSKIVFARPYLPVSFEMAEGAPKDAGVFVSQDSRFEPCSYTKPVFHRGFSKPIHLEGEVARQTLRNATLLLPVESLEDPGRLHLRLRVRERSRTRTRKRSRASTGSHKLRVSIEDTHLGTLKIGPAWRSHRLSVPAEIGPSAGVDVINNVGSFLREDGAAGDRGIYEPDRGQYDEAEDVSSLCGCSMLVRRSVLDAVGFFDRDFFMYYEDTELSWRIRKGGYRLRFVPGSVVRHFHASTSVEWSPLFNFLVARNRILMLIKHAAPRHALRAYAEEAYRLIQLLKTHRSLRAEPVRTRLRIQASLLWQAPRAGLKRIGILSH